jgi:DNA-binding CsgD family transcriptional regulator
MMAAFSDGFSFSPAGAPSSRPTGGSISDLYPKAVAIQRLAGARSFAVLAASAQTAVSRGALTTKMRSPEDEKGVLNVAYLVETHGPDLLLHLWKSPLPLRFDAHGIRPLPPIEFESEEGPERRVDYGIAFPVHLGGLGNGYFVVCGVAASLDAESCIDLHRKSIGLMREALKLEFGNLATTEMLSEREIECLQLVGDGLKSEAIGERLGLSVHTVNAYLGSATTKLDAVNRIQAIAKAIRLGLIS